MVKLRPSKLKSMLISKNHKIYIAGHCGMVGSAIKRALIKKGYKNRFKFIRFFSSR